MDNENEKLGKEKILKILFNLINIFYKYTKTTIVISFILNFSLVFGIFYFIIGNDNIIIFSLIMGLVLLMLEIFTVILLDDFVLAEYFK